MTLKWIWLQFRLFIQKIIKLLIWLLSDIKRIYISLMLLLLYLFLHLFINNIESEVTWKTIIPGFLIGLVTLLGSLYFELKNKKSWDDFHKDFVQKAILAVSVGLFGSYITLRMSLKEEVVSDTFPLRLIINRETGETLEKYDARYNLLYGSKHYQARRYLKYRQRSDFKDNEWRVYTFNYPFDVFFLEVLSIGLTSCEQTNVVINPIGGGAYRCFPEKSLIWPKFPQSISNQLEPRVQEMCSELKDKEIFKLYGMDKMCLPKGTKIKLEYSDSWDHKTNKAFCKTIKLENKFCEINIDVTYYGGENRIQDWGAGQSLKWRWILGFDDEMNKKFGTYTGRVYFEAKFNKMLSGHPDMPQYKKWARELLWRLQWHLDSDEQLKQAEQEYLIYNADITDFIKKYERKITTEVERNDPNKVNINN